MELTAINEIYAVHSVYAIVLRSKIMVTYKPATRVV